MVIFDSQAHIGGANTRERPWPVGRENQAQRPAPLGADELHGAMDAAGVDRVVIVPPSWEGDRNDLALAAALRYPNRFAVMGRFPVETAAEGGQLPTWREQPGMLGVRLTLHRDPWKSWLGNGGGDWVWAGGARALPERRRQAVGASVLHERDVPLPRPPPPHPARLRRLRPAADALGHGLFAPALPVPPGRHALHGGARLPFPRGQGVDHGASDGRVARLAHLTRARSAPPLLLSPLTLPSPPRGRG